MVALDSQESCMQKRDVSTRGRKERKAQPSTNSADSSDCQPRAAWRSWSDEAWRRKRAATKHQMKMFEMPIALRATHHTSTRVDSWSVMSLPGLWPSMCPPVAEMPPIWHGNVAAADCATARQW